jgi:hypothetical protein
MNATLNKRINSSIEWTAIESDILHKSSKLINRRDIQRFVKNLQQGVTQLSKAEVEARRGKKIKAIEILSKVNADIEMVEEYLLIAALLG